MLLTELFDSPAPYKLVHRKPAVYAFVVGDVEYTMEISQYNFTDPTYEVGFSVQGGEVDDERYFHKKYGVTGTGNASVVMATVLSILNSFLSDVTKPVTLTFSAEEESRRKLYTSIANRLAKAYGAELHIDGSEFEVRFC